MASTQSSRGRDVSSTRQMLDELDALMERMLALPVQESEEAGPPSEPTKPPAVAATLTLVEPEREPPAEPEPEIFQTRVSVPESVFPAPAFSEYEEIAPETLLPRSNWQPSAETLPVDHPPERHQPIPLIEVKVPKVQEPVALPKPNLRRRRVFSWWWLPILWVNRGFDRMTYLLGPWGRPLRTVKGRFRLGMIGLFLLTLSAAWLYLDWAGWSLMDIFLK